VIVSGPVNVPTPAGVRRIDVETAEQMMDAVRAELPGTISSSQPRRCPTTGRAGGAEKIKKTSDSLMLALSRTPTSSRRWRPARRGRSSWASRPRRRTSSATRSSSSKQAPRHDRGQPGGDRLAFDCDDNALTVYWPGGKRELARASKRDVAAGLVSVIAERLRAASAWRLPTQQGVAPATRRHDEHRAGTRPCR